jgi:hypothetical protein
VKGKGEKNERNENLEQTLNGCVSWEWRGIMQGFKDHRKQGWWF